MIEIKVLDKRWKVFLEDEDTYCKRWGDGDAAHTINKDKEIYFNEAELDRVTVIHELCHAFYGETCTSSANLKPAQVEEVFCELIGNHGDHIVRLGRKLYKELKNNG